MNKNLIIVLIVVGVLALSGIGYAVWSNYNFPKVAVQNQAVTTPNQDSGALQIGSPVVQTISNTAPYISTVVVSGTVDPRGAETIYWYEYGQTSVLGTQTHPYSIGSGYATFYTPAYITGLASNTTYYFRLSAKNSVGTASGTVYTFKTNNTPAPSGVAPAVNTSSAASVTRTTADLSGQINPKNSVTTYWFEYGVTSNLGSVTSFQSSDNSNSSLNVLVSVSNLQPATKYYFRVNAQNQFGTTNGQILNFTTNGPADTIAPNVSANPVNAITSTSAKLNANVNPNGVSATYWFEYSNNSDFSSASSTPEQALNSISSVSNVSANISNLASNTKYYVRVVAKNQYGTVRGGAVTFTTKK